MDYSRSEACIARIREAAWIAVDKEDCGPRPAAFKNIALKASIFTSTYCIFSRLLPSCEKQHGSRAGDNPAAAGSGAVAGGSDVKPIGRAVLAPFPESSALQRARSGRVIRTVMPCATVRHASDIAGGERFPRRCSGPLGAAAKPRTTDCSSPAAVVRAVAVVVGFECCS